jgi:hypothetical protein
MGKFLQELPEFNLLLIFSFGRETVYYKLGRRRVLEILKEEADRVVDLRGRRSIAERLRR